MKRYIGQTAITLLIALVGISIIVAGIKLIELKEPFVDLSKTENTIGPEQAKKMNESGLKFAIATIESAENTFLMYHELVKKIGSDVGMDETFILRPSYHDIRIDIKEKNIDVALVCTGTYIHPDIGKDAKLLVRPNFKGDYRGLIIVPAGSTVRTLQELKGGTMAFTDPESFTGCIVPSVAIADLGYNFRNFFGRVIFTGIHDRAILAVANGIVDCAGVNSLVFESMLETDPTLAGRVRIIWRSPVYGAPVILIPSDLDKDLEKSLLNAFLKFHESEKGKDILSQINIANFIIPKAEEYRTARELFEKYKKLGYEQWH